MVIEKYIVSNVVNYCLVESKIYVILKNSKLAVFDSKDSICLREIENEFEINRFIPNTEKILGVRNDGKAIVFDLELNTIDAKILEEVKIGLNDKIDDSIIAYRGRIKNREWGLYSYQKLSYDWVRSDIKSLQKIDSYIFSQDQFKLSRHNYSNGEIEWTVDFAELYESLIGERGRIILYGVSNSILVVGIESLNRVIAISVESGSINWNIEALTKGLQLGEGTGFFYQFLIGYGCYSLIDGTIVDSLNDRDYFAKNGIESQRSNYVLRDDFIITTDWKLGNLAKFNLETKKFEWVLKKDGFSFPAGSEMKLLGSILCVKDNYDSLHIYDIERVIIEQYS